MMEPAGLKEAQGSYRPIYHPVVVFANRRIRLKFTNFKYLNKNEQIKLFLSYTLDCRENINTLYFGPDP